MNQDSLNELDKQFCEGYNNAVAEDYNLISLDIMHDAFSALLRIARAAIKPLPSEEKLVDLIMELIKPYLSRKQFKKIYPDSHPCIKIERYVADDIVEALSPYLQTKQDNGWIDISDRLPVVAEDDDSECAVIIEDKRDGIYSVYTQTAYKRCVTDEIDPRQPDRKATHWYDLPPLPKPPTSKAT